MADLTSTIKIYEEGRVGIDSPGVKRIYVITPTTTDGADTFTIDITKYRADTLLGISGHRHATANSVIVVYNPTTSVTAGVMTVTLGAAFAFTDNRMMFEIWLGQGGI